MKERRKISTLLTPGIEPGPSSPLPSALPLELPGYDDNNNNDNDNKMIITIIMIVIIIDKL